ncbi:GNAT family N-acetyltransferase [Pyxidicoccus trucidator]|uniref:GNAT family N-acetyltransferase n=1 Tax=Pyxidicoccus trucidator TaxID=2709662 RepID=UPI0013DD7C07|nr:GNAT family N-acetyltransferase [Pyxidicoccus trucidator]
MVDNKSPPLLREGTQESRRFGFRIFRGSVEVLEEQPLLDELLAKEVDIAIVRLLKTGHEQLHKLERLGLPFIVADTLVYYACDLTRLQPVPLHNPDLEFVECNASHAGAVERLVALSFRDYRNHYSANPLLVTSGLMEGYQEWTRGYTSAGEAGKRAWLVRSGGEDVAFATVSFEEGVSEIVLNGVHPAHAGRGIYGDLIRFVQGVSRERGASLLRISTQVSNFAVQKVWSRSGFSLVDAYLTVHINALLSAVGVHHAVRPVRFERAGSDGDLVPGVSVLAEAARFFTSDFPGPGSLITRQRSRFLQPVHAGRDYTLDYRFPIHDPARGTSVAVVTLRDSTGAALLVSHTELVRQ